MGTIELDELYFESFKYTLEFLVSTNRVLFPETTMLGALSRYIADDTIKNFQPMGAALGLLPPLPDRIRDKRARYAAICERGMRNAAAYIDAEKLR